MPDLRPISNRDSGTTTVAVIGAGISGLTCARMLTERGLVVTVFEKSRGVGGRTATRRAGDTLQFDHGAPWFTVRDERFSRQVESWSRRGAVAPWRGRVCVLHGDLGELEDADAIRFVGVPGMNAICRELASGLDVRPNTQISFPQRHGWKWLVSDRQGKRLGQFDWVLVSCPAPQAAELLAEAPLLCEQARSASMAPCWAAVLGFEENLNLDFDAAFVERSPLSWLARDNSKPGRDGARDTWVLHASTDWSREHLEQPADSVLSQLVEEFRRITGHNYVTPVMAVAHRWRYARPVKTLSSRCIIDPDMQIGACGDWCAGPHVEGAYLSGLALAEAVVDAVQPESDGKQNVIPDVLLQKTAAAE